jgi:bifunctional oligoribonuclease and PAP phosphatase NrnA
MQVTKKEKLFGKKIFQALKARNKILITSHTDPDDDSISAVLSLYHILIEKFPQKKIQIFYSGQVGDRWKNFSLYHKIQTVIDVNQIIDQYDTLICLDCNYFQRVSFNGYLLQSSDCLKICIDHHTSKPDKFDLALIKPSATSTAQLIFDSFGIKAGKHLPELTRMLLLGILGDTGGLRYISADNARVLGIAGWLVQQGRINLDTFISSYSNYAKRSFLIVQEMVRNTQFKKIKSWPEFNYAFIDNKYIRQHRLSQLEILDGAHIFIENFSTSMQDSTWGIVAYPQSDQKIKLSLRSRPDGPNVRRIVEEMNIGSGHNRSSGGTIDLDKNEGNTKAGLDFLFEWMKENNPGY